VFLETLDDGQSPKNMIFSSAKYVLEELVLNPRISLAYFILRSRRRQSLSDAQRMTTHYITNCQLQNSLPARVLWIHCKELQR
jgi:hypothetical protein